MSEKDNNLDDALFPKIIFSFLMIFMFCMSVYFYGKMGGGAKVNIETRVDPSSLSNYVSNYEEDVKLFQTCLEVKSKDCDTHATKKAAVDKMINVNRLSDYVSVKNFSKGALTDSVLSTKSKLAYANLSVAHYLIYYGDIDNGAKAYILAFNADMSVALQDTSIVQLLASKKSRISQNNLSLLENIGFKP